MLVQVKAQARRHRLPDVEADCTAIPEALIELAARAEKEGRAEEARFGDWDIRVARLHIDDLHATFEKVRSAGSLGLHRTIVDAIDGPGPPVTHVRKPQDDQSWSE